MLPASPYVATKSRSKALVSLGASILAAARQDNAAHGKVNVQLLRVALFFIDSVKVCLDLVFSAAATRLPISSNELEYADPEQFDESFNDKFAQLMDELQIKDNAMAPQVTLTGTSSSEVGENFCKLMGSLDLTEDECKHATPYVSALRLFHFSQPCFFKGMQSPRLNSQRKR